MQLGQTEDGFNINQYFVDHPEMVLGNLELESTQYGHDLTVAPIEDAEYAELLIKKKAAYPDYRKARDEMQELMKAQKNVELFFAEDKSNLRPQHTR